MTELTKYIGPDLDIPSMGYGVGMTEVGIILVFSSLVFVGSANLSNASRTCRVDQLTTVPDTLRV